MEQAAAIKSPAAAAPARKSSATSPQALMTWFVLSGLVSVLVVLGGVGYGTYELMRYLVLKDASYASVGIGKALLERERELFVATATGRAQIVIDPANFQQLDDRMRKYLIPFNMYKIKVFDANKRIVYSTDRSIINKLDDKNEKLLRTLTKGEIIPKVGTKEKVQDLAGEQLFNVEVAETYLPIRDENNAIIGAFEVYTNVNAYKREMTNVLALGLTISLAVIVVLLLALFLPMRKSVTQLESAYAALRRLAGVRPKK